MLEEIEKRAKVKTAKEFSLPQACSCGSAVTDTPGRGERREGGGNVSVDCGAQTETHVQSAL